MPRCAATILSVLLAASPALALDLGLGGKAGRTGISASVGVGPGGVSVGVDADVGGLGSVNAGASVGTDGGGTDASVGVSTSVGGADVGAEASVGVGEGTTGASVGASASVGGVSTSASIGDTGASVSVGGADAGTGVSAGSPGASVGGNLGKSSRGGGVPSASVGDSSSTGGSVATGSTGGSATSSGNGGGILGGLFGSSAGDSDTDTPDASVRAKKLKVAKRVRHSIILPRAIRPNGGRGRVMATSFVSKPGTPRPVVLACRNAIRSAAAPLGMVSVRAISAGVLYRRKGAVSAPILVRIRYATREGTETRQARVRCHIDVAGRVVAVT